MGDLPGVKLQRGLRLAIVTIALVHLLGLSLPSLVLNARAYRVLAVEIVAFVIIAALLAGLGIAAWRERPVRHWYGFAVLVLVSVMALAGMPPSVLLTAAEWSFGVVCWAGMLLLLDFGFLAVVTFLVAHLAARLALLGVVGVADRTAVAAALTFTAGMLSYQVGIAFAATLLRRMANAVSSAVEEEERLRTAEAVAERLHRDRQERYAGLDTVPLLTGLAAGVLDPADDSVRTRCAVEAGRLRRLFAERDEVSDPLLHELQACVDTAERRGVSVYLGVCGIRREPPLSVRRALTEPVLTVLATARSHARVTVIGSPVAVTVSVVADGDPPPSVPSGDGVVVTRLAENGRHWVEATWQT